MKLRLDLYDPFLAPDERPLYRQAWWLLNLLAPGLRLLGLVRCQRLLRTLIRLPGSGPAPDEGLARAHAIARVVRVATWRSAFRADCLEQTLTLWTLLQRARIPATLRVGMRRAPEGVQGHAWVEVGGEVVSELTDPRHRYVPFAALEARLAEGGA